MAPDQPKTPPRLDVIVSRSNSEPTGGYDAPMIRYGHFVTRDKFGNPIKSNTR